MKIAKALLSATLLAAPLALGQASAAVAAPLGTPPVQHAQPPIPGIILAGHRRGHGGGHFHGGGPRFGGHWGGYGHFPGRHFRRFGPGIGFGLPYYYYGPSYYYGYYGPSYYDDDFDDDDGPEYSDDDVARCQARYRSFDVRSGTFLGNDGRRRRCPYLE